MMRWRKPILWILVGVAALAVYFLFDPATANFFPGCVFLKLTGLKCPGCGSQRAVHSLLHLDFAAAFRYNALLVLSLPVVFFLLVVEMLRTRCPRLYSRVHSQAVIWTIVAIVLVWWVMRNFFNSSSVGLV